MLLQNKELQIGNGKMIPMIDKSLLKKVDIDIALSAFYFESNNYFKELTTLHNYTDKEGDNINSNILTFNRQMGYMKRDEKLLKEDKNPYTYNEKFEIIEPEMIKLFGNYNNYIRYKEKQFIKEYNEYNTFSFVNFLFRKNK